MKKNPFQTKTPGRTSIRAALSNVFNTKEIEPVVKKKKEETLVESSTVVDEEVLHSTLSVQKEKSEKEPLLSGNSMYNYINASVGETEKDLLRKKIECTVYYQTPETHTIRKEESGAYDAVFQNWRKGLSGLFAEYRKANTMKNDFSFCVYYDRTVYHFHTVGYNSCKSLCCKDSSIYALYAVSPHSLSNIFDSDFKQDKMGWCLSGRSVLFVLDTIINAQATTVCSLPLVLSKYPFINGIVTKPLVVIKPEKHRNRRSFRVVVKGWVLSEDILMLNTSAQLEAKQE